MDLIILSGLPASGKSTVAKALQGAFPYPILEKDRIKECLFDTLGFQSHAEKRRLDAAADPTGKYLEALGDMLPFPEQEKLPLKWLLYNLGRWIYLMDAWDDREKDGQKGTFNP